MYGGGKTARARVVVAVSAGGRKTVGVGGDWGIELSEDDGVTWRTSAPPLDPGSGVSFLSFDPVLSDVLYCGSFRHPFRSRDGGRTWLRIANGMVEDTEVFAIDFSPFDPNDFWAATCGWVYRTTDGAANWTRYREGLADRRSQAVRVDPRDASRVLVGTTGGLFESRDRGKTFRRISADVVVNAIVFDPRDPSRLIVGTEAEGVLRSEDGGVTLTESNRGLSEARVSAVALLPSGRVVVARAADGKSGGLWSLDAITGDVERLASSPPATVLALASSGESLLAAAPDGIYRAARVGARFTRPGARDARVRVGRRGRIFAATNAGVFESTNGGLRGGASGPEIARGGRRRARLPTGASRPGRPTRRGSPCGGTDRSGRGARCPARAVRCRAASGARAKWRTSFRSPSASRSRRSGRFSSTGRRTTPKAESPSRCPRPASSCGVGGRPAHGVRPVPCDDRPRPLRFVPGG